MILQFSFASERAKAADIELVKLTKLEEKFEEVYTHSDFLGRKEKLFQCWCHRTHSNLLMSWSMMRTWRMERTSSKQKVENYINGVPRPWRPWRIWPGEQTFQVSEATKVYGDCRTVSELTAAPENLGRWFSGSSLEGSRQVFQDAHWCRWATLSVCCFLDKIWRFSAGSGAEWKDCFPKKTNESGGFDISPN